MLTKNLLPLFLQSTYSIFIGRGSSVGIVNGYELDDRGFGVRGSLGSRIFTSPVQNGSGVHPAFNPMSYMGDLSPGVKAAEA
jgi:hypothetical protein